MVRRSGRRAFPVNSSPFTVDEDGVSNRLMCGPPAVTRMLTKGRSSRSHESLHDDNSSLSSRSRNSERDRYNKKYYPEQSAKTIPPFGANDDEYEIVPMEELQKQKDVVVPQFDIKKATKYKGRIILSPVSEGSNESRMDLSESNSNSGYAARAARQENDPGVTPKTLSEQHLERTIVAMRHLIVQQQRNLKTLEEQNTRYRANLATCQEHILALKKTQLDQQDEVHKLNFDCESSKAEILWLRGELKTNRGENSKSHSIPQNGQTARFGMPEEEMESQRGHDSGENVSESELKWALQQRSKMNTYGRKSRSEKDKESSPRATNEAPKRNTPGKCDDIEELQRRASNLRIVVSRMKQQDKSEGENESRDDNFNVTGYAGAEIGTFTSHSRDAPPASQWRGQQSGTARVRFHSDVTSGKLRGRGAMDTF